MGAIISPRVLCLGEILFDCLADQIGVELAQVQSWTRYPGGAPANVACGLVKLGIPAGFIGCVGFDHAGDELVQLLLTQGVNYLGLQRDVSLPTREVYVTRTTDGDRQFAGFGSYQTTNFADTHLRAGGIPVSLFERVDYLVMGTIAMAYPQSRQASERAIELAKAQNTRIFLDINWRPVFWTEPALAIAAIQSLLPQANLLKCTDEEADWLFQTQDPGQIQAVYPHLQGVLVTAGEKGCHYRLGHTQGFIPAFKVAVQDTTGAGDAFVAGFLEQACHLGDRLFTEDNLAHQAVRYASAVGALTTLNPGAIAAQPTPEQVQKFLAEHPL